MTALALRPVPINANLHIFANFPNNGIGGVVMYSTDADWAFHLSKFLSRILRDAENRYPAIEGEATATLWAISQSQPDILKS